MKFSKEQKDYIIHALEHCEVLTGGRGSGKTLELIKQQEEEIESLKQINEEHQKINGELRADNDRLNNVINELDGYLDLKRKSYIEGFKWSGLEIIDQTKDFLQELKGDDK